MTYVALVKTHDRATGVNKALDLLEMSSPKGKNQFSKPNFDRADVKPGSTHDNNLSVLVSGVQTMGDDRRLSRWRTRGG